MIVWWDPKKEAQYLLSDFYCRQSVVSQWKYDRFKTQSLFLSPKGMDFDNFSRFLFLLAIAKYKKFNNRYFQGLRLSITETDIEKEPQNPLFYQIMLNVVRAHCFVFCGSNSVLRLDQPDPNLFTQNYLTSVH